MYNSKMLTLLFCIMFLAVIINNEIIFGEDQIKYTVFPKEFLGIDGSSMTKEKLIKIMEKRKVKYDILLDEPPGHWIGSKYFIGNWLEEFSIKYVVYSFPDIGGNNFEMEIEIEGRQFNLLLNKFFKILGPYNMSYESFVDRRKIYYWVTKKRDQSGGIEEVAIRYKSNFIDSKNDKDNIYIFIRWYVPITDIYAPIHR